MHESFKICIATPAYGGMVTTQYAGSLADTVTWMQEDDRIAYGIYLLSNESQIHRARNKCVAFARKHLFTHLMFIDADLGWRPEQLQKLLESGKRIIGGTYPVKKLPIKLNYNVLPGAFSEGRILEVRHVPTGFLLIDMDVFERLEPYVRNCMKEDLTTGERFRYEEYFVPGINEEGEDLSEDWAFCGLAQRFGERTFLHMDVILPHVGTYEYRHET